MNANKIKINNFLKFGFGGVRIPAVERSRQVDSEHKASLGLHTA